MHILEQQSERLPLFPQADPCKRKHQGNAQSVEAFRKVNVTGDCARIMAYYANGARLTPKEVAHLLDVQLNRVSGRFITLKRAGLLRATGVVRDGSGELEAV